jgi:hypothetical protein
MLNPSFLCTHFGLPFVCAHVAGYFASGSQSIRVIFHIICAGVCRHTFVWAESCLDRFWRGGYVFLLASSCMSHASLAGRVYVWLHNKDHIFLFRVPKMTKCIQMISVGSDIHLQVPGATRHRDGSPTRPSFSRWRYFKRECAVRRHSAV